MASVSCSASVRCRQGGTSRFIHGGSRTPWPTANTVSSVCKHDTCRVCRQHGCSVVWETCGYTNALPSGLPHRWAIDPVCGQPQPGPGAGPSLPRSPGQQTCLQEASMTQAMTAPDKFTSASCCLKTKPLGHQKSCRFSLSESFIFWEGLCVKNMDQRCLRSPAVPGVLASSPPCWLPSLVLPQGHHAPWTHDESAALLNT